MQEVCGECSWEHAQAVKDIDWADGEVGFSSDSKGPD